MHAYDPPWSNIMLPCMKTISDLYNNFLKILLNMDVKSMCDNKTKIWTLKVFKEKDTFKCRVEYSYDISKLWFIFYTSCIAINLPFLSTPGMMVKRKQIFWLNRQNECFIIEKRKESKNSQQMKTFYKNQSPLHNMSISVIIK